METNYIPRDDYRRSPYDCVVEFTQSDGMRFFKHPLYNGIFYPREQGLKIGMDPDEAVRVKLSMLKDAFARRDVHSYVFTHERPWRFPALLDARDWAKAADWWPCAGDTWVDSEGPGVNALLWRLHVWADPKARATMGEEDAIFLRDLPDVVTAYRGADNFRHAAHGFSWTLSRERAVWFAHRFTHRGTPIVATITVPKSRITAAFAGRGEQEVIIIDAKLRDARVEKLS